jgi:hypothetical protein
MTIFFAPCASFRITDSTSFMTKDGDDTSIQRQSRNWRKSTSILLRNWHLSYALLKIKLNNKTIKKLKIEKKKLKKRKKKRTRKKREKEVAWATPLDKMGVARALGVARLTPFGLGMGSATPTRPKRKENKNKKSS